MLDDHLAEASTSQLRVKSSHIISEANNSREEVSAVNTDDMPALESQSENEQQLYASYQSEKEQQLSASYQCMPSIRIF